MKNYWLEKREHRLHERWQAPSTDENYWLPIRPYLTKEKQEDIEYFRNKLFNALSFPKKEDK